MTGAIILTLFLVLYVFLGGMRSVAATDVVQGILMFIMMFLAVWIISDKLGGLRIANQSVMDINPDLFSRQGGEGHFTYKTWFSSMILWMLCVPMFPQMFMRFFIAKNAASFKISTILYAVIPLALFIGPVIIGVLGHLNYPNLEGNAPDKILPMLLMELVPIGITAIILVGAIAAFMSTLDSQLLALSTMITRDLYVGFFNPKLKFRAQVIFGKVMIVILAGVGLLLAANPPTAIYDLVKYAFTGYAVLFPTTVAVIYLKRKIPALSCIGSILLGEAFVLGSYLGWIPDSLLFGFDLILPVIIITLVPLIIGYVFRNSISN
ncbi:MAG: sodium:solute symporter family protein [Bacteroidetes bacterium]|nr:sodium:solute symporter family protein [Bacteroidota bacterium]